MSLGAERKAIRPRRPAATLARESAAKRKPIRPRRPAATLARESAATEKRQSAAEQLRYSLGLPLGAGVNELSKALQDYDLTVADTARWWQVDCRQEPDCFRVKVESRIEGIRPLGPLLLLSAVGGFAGAFALSWAKYR